MSISTIKSQNRRIKRKTEKIVVDGVLSLSLYRSKFYLESPTVNKHKLHFARNNLMKVLYSFYPCVVFTPVQKHHKDEEDHHRYRLALVILSTSIGQIADAVDAKVQASELD